MADRARVEPALTERRGLSRSQAAAYIGVSPTMFDAMIDDCLMPKPKCIGARRVWDRHALDEAFMDLPDADAPTPAVRGVRGGLAA